MASKMVKVHATKPGDQIQWPEATGWKERTDSCMLSSDPHMYAMTQIKIRIKARNFKKPASKDKIKLNF